MGVPEWWLNAKLWETANLYCAVPQTEAQKKERLRRAVVSKVYCGCIIIRVNFGGTHEQKALPAPAA